MRLLRLTEENKQKVDRLLEFAEKPVNWHYPGKSDFVPGDIGEYVAQLDSFRCVFSFSVAPDGRIFRFLSISIPGGNLPHPLAAFTIATWMGFTGGEIENDVTVRPGKDWMMDIEKQIPLVKIVQEIKQKDGSSD